MMMLGRRNVYRGISLKYFVKREWNLCVPTFPGLIRDERSEDVRVCQEYRVTCRCTTRGAHTEVGLETHYIVVREGP